jgi:TPR repeat protein
MAQPQQYVTAPPPAPPKHVEAVLSSPMPTHYNNYNNSINMNNMNMNPPSRQHFSYSATNNSAPSLPINRQSSPLPPTQETSKTPPGTRTSSVMNLSINGDQLLDHSHLKPGAKASLLSYAQTINMYRENAKKTNSPDIQCDFAIFMVEAAKPIQEDDETRWEYLAEAEKLLKQLAARGHAESQYYLGNLFASGLLSKKGKNEFDKAFPLFVQATKHHHADAAYR